MKFILLTRSKNNVIEPVGAKSPTFSTESMGSIFRKRVGQPFTLLCQAQSYPAPIFRQVIFFFHITEPVASKAPTFSTDARSTTFVRNVGQSFGLLCQAQAFPVPVFRQVCCKICFLMSRLQKSRYSLIIENLNFGT